METHEAKDKIRIRAHQLWEEAGCLHGHDVDHWLQAEKELLMNSVAAAPLMEEAKAAPNGEPEEKPARKAKTESSAQKASKKSAGRGKNK